MDIVVHIMQTSILPQCQSDTGHCWVLCADLLYVPRYLLHVKQKLKQASAMVSQVPSLPTLSTSDFHHLVPHWSIIQHHPGTVRLPPALQRAQRQPLPTVLTEENALLCLRHRKQSFINKWCDVYAHQCRDCRSGRGDAPLSNNFISIQSMLQGLQAWGVKFSLSPGKGKLWDLSNALNLFSRCF